MKKNNTRLAVVAGATMALVLASTAVVSAAGPRDHDRGRGMAEIGPMESGQMMPGSPGMGGMRGMRGFDADVERTEHTVQTADGTTSVRVEQGVADSVADGSLTFSLGSGEAVTVVIDEETQVVALEEQELTTPRGWSRTRMAPTEVEAAAIEAGSEVVVWSDSEDGADFVASRIVIEPAGDSEAAAAEDVAAEEIAEPSEAPADTTGDAATTDA